MGDLLDDIGKDCNSGGCEQVELGQAMLDNGDQCPPCNGTSPTIINNPVSESRRIDTTAPLYGGGDFSEDRTHFMTPATDDQDGYMTKEDHRLLRRNAGYGLLSGSATWSGTGLTFDVTDTAYIIGGILYKTDAQQITLSASDPTLPRIDVIYVDDEEEVHVITGTPAANPIKPQVDMSSQVELTFVLIGAGALTPTGITEEVVYNENNPPTEWEGEFIGFGVVADFASTDTPQTGTLNIKIPEFTGLLKRSLLFTDATPSISPDKVQYIKFWAKVTTYQGPQILTIVTFMNGGSTVSGSFIISHGNYGYNRDLIDTWQLITLPGNEIMFPQFSLLPELRFLFVDNQKGMQFDRIVIQSGNDVPVPLSAVLSFNTRTGHVISEEGDYHVYVTGDPLGVNTYPPTGDRAKLYINEDDDSTWYWDGDEYRKLSDGAAVALEKALFSDLNTGTDDAKYATSLALELSKYTDQDGTKIYAVSSGTNNYTAAFTPPITAYVQGQVFYVKFTNANTTATTININGLGVKDLIKGVGTDLESGDLIPGKIYPIRYDGTDFQLDIPTSLGKLTIAELNTGTDIEKYPNAAVLQGSKYTNQNNTKNFAVATGTGTYAAVMTPAITAYVQGQTFDILFTNANDGPSTINLGPSAKALVKNVNQALQAGDIPAGKVLTIYYDGTRFQIDVNKTFAGSAIISGSAVWSGTGLTFDVTDTEYIILGNYYDSLATQVTLTAADPVEPRIDVIYLDVTGNVGVLTGTPDANPVKPQVDPENQIELSFVLVEAGATTPTGITNEVIYDENTESTGASNATGVNFAFATGSFNGAVNARVTSYTNGQYLSFLKPAPLLISNYQFLIFRIKLPVAFSTSTFLTAFLYNTNTAITQGVNITSGAFGFNRNTATTWQLITIPLSSFVPTQNSFNRLYFRLNGAAPSGFQLDFVILQVGLSNNAPNGVQSFNGRTGNVVSIPADYTPAFIGAEPFAGLPGGNGYIWSSTTGGTRSWIPAPSGIDYFKGVYTTLGALQAAFPTTIAGAYAQIDPGAGDDLVLYLYDLQDGWVATASGGGVVPVKATAAELNTGSDDAKFATAFALENSKYANQDNTKNYVVASGTNTYTGTLTPAITAYVAGQRFEVKFTNANTTASTINLNGLGAKDIWRDNSNALSTGDLSAGKVTTLVYDGTRFQLIANTSLATVVPVKATAAELNTGSDDAKFATALGLENSKYTNQNNTKNYAVASGTNTYAATITPAIAAYVAGQRFEILFTNANSGASTLALNGLLGKELTKDGSSPLLSGDLPAGKIMVVIYDGVRFQVIGIASGGGIGGVAWGDITGDPEDQTDIQDATLQGTYVPNLGGIALGDTLKEAIEKLDGRLGQLTVQIGTVQVANNLFLYYNFK